MVRPVLVIGALLTLAGCARATLPYTPAQQPSGATVSAAYQVVGDRLKIDIDTDGRRLEDATILRADGSAVRPQTIEHAPYAPAGGSGVSIGIGGGTFGGHSGVGGGVGVGVPVGGSPRLQGPTLAYFPFDQAGPAPWRLMVKIAGIDPVMIMVGPAAPAPGAPAPPPPAKP